MMYDHERKEKKARYVGPRPGYPELDPEGWSAFDAYLGMRGLDSTLAVANGWYPALYQGVPRIVIPCSNKAGVPYFQARDVTGRAKLRYASPPASRDDSIVTAWPLTEAKSCVILEGPMCALAAAAQGHLGIALMGNQPSREVMERVSFYAKSFKLVQILPDADMMSMGASVMSWLSQEGITCILRMLPKKDLADMSIKDRKGFLTL